MSQSRFLHEEYSKKIRKVTIKAAIDVAVADLVAAINVRHSNGGKRLTKGDQLYKHMIASLQANGINITHNALKQRVSRASVEDRRELVEREIRLTTSVRSLSSLSNDESLSLSESESHDIEGSKTSNAGGRPKGSTKAKKNQDIDNESKCIDAIVSEYSKRYNTSKSIGGKVEYGYMKKLIDEKKKEFGVNCTRTISTRTIQNRTHRGRTLTTHHGAKAPLEEVELALVQICIQMGKIRQPLSCTEAITLMNDLIENTDTKQKLIEFQQSRNLGTYGFEKGRVTTGWWRGFLRRHKDKLVTKRGEKFALNRSDWTTLPNIKQMYDVIYNEMVDAHVAVTLQNPIFTDINGKPEDDKTKMFELKQIIITNPKWILFANESRFNT